MLQWNCTNKMRRLWETRVWKDYPIGINIIVGNEMKVLLNGPILSYKINYYTIIILLHIILIKLFSLQHIIPF